MFSTHISDKAARRPGPSFGTMDFYLACYLRCAGYRLVGVREEGRRTVFLFDDRPERRADVLAFYNSEGSVRPLTFVGIIRDMKSLLHNA